MAPLEWGPDGIFASGLDCSLLIVWDELRTVR